jgi:hypothetical protein
LAGSVSSRTSPKPALAGHGSHREGQLTGVDATSRSRPVAAGGDRRLTGILNGRLLAPTIGSKLLRQFWIELAAFLRIA